MTGNARVGRDGGHLVISLHQHCFSPPPLTRSCIILSPNWFVLLLWLTKANSLTAEVVLGITSLNSVNYMQRFWQKYLMPHPRLWMSSDCGASHTLVSSGHRGTSGDLLAPLVLVNHLMFTSRATKSKVSGGLRLYSSAIVNLNSPPPPASVCNEWPISSCFSTLDSRSEWGLATGLFFLSLQREKV